jgi:hypothetical protein
MNLGPVSSADSSGFPIWWFAWMGFVVSVIAWGSWQDLLRRRVIRKYVLSIGLRPLGNTPPSYLPIAEAGARRQPREVSGCYAGVVHGSEVAIYDLRIGSGKHVRRRTVVAVQLSDPDSFKPPSTLTLLGFDFERENGWVLVVLLATKDDANQIASILDYLTGRPI